MSPSAILMAVLREVFDSPRNPSHAGGFLLYPRIFRKILNRWEASFLKIVTFNLRCDSVHDAVNSFAHRKGAIIDKIETEKPDIIGFQECRPHMHAFLKKYLVDYAFFGRTRGGNWTESNPIAFRKDKFDLVGLETQWLSPTPFVPGSRYEIQSDCPRILTHMMLEGTDGKFVHVICTHLDHVSEEARVQGAEHLIGYMKAELKKWDYPLVLMGDFNAVPTEACIDALLGDKELGLTDQTANIEHSYHGFGTVDIPRIDYIMTRGFEKAAETVAWTEEAYGVYLSDHYPLMAELNQLY